MQKLSTNARALLDALATEHTAPADLGEQPLVAGQETRVESAANKRRVSYWVGGVVVASAAAVLLAVGLAPAQGSTEALPHSPTQAPYHRGDTAKAEANEATVYSPKRVPESSRMISPAPQAAFVQPAQVQEVELASPHARPLREVQGVHEVQKVVPSAAATLAKEVRLLDRARVALQHKDSVGALRALDAHQAQFAQGALSVERRALRKQTENFLAAEKKEH